VITEPLFRIRGGSASRRGIEPGLEESLHQGLGFREPRLLRRGKANPGNDRGCGVDRAVDGTTPAATAPCSRPAGRLRAASAATPGTDSTLHGPSFPLGS
jgi:hypothetical protein